MKIHVIVVAYQRDVGLRILIDSFLQQTNNNWVITIIHDGPAPDNVIEIIDSYDNIPEIMFIETEKRLGSWGNPNRQLMINVLNADPDDYLLLTNDDNYYTPLFVELMLGQAGPDVGMVYCDFLHHNYAYSMISAKPVINSIDYGAFIVNAKLAKEIGFEDKGPGSDGLFAEKINKECQKRKFKAIHLEKCLFVHN